MSLREELIQVAAVAVAIVEDLDKSVAYDLDPWNESIISDIINERIRQDEKWGPQHHTPGEWLAILMEEVGEVAEEISGTYERYPVNELVSRIYTIGRISKHWLDEYIFPPKVEQ